MGDQDSRTKRIRELLGEKRKLPRVEGLTEHQENAMTDLFEAVDKHKDWEVFKWLADRQKDADGELIVDEEIKFIFIVTSTAKDYNDKKERLTYRYGIGLIGLLLEDYYQDRKAREATK